MPHNAAWPVAVGAAPSASRAHRTDCPSVRWPCHPQAFIVRAAGVRDTHRLVTGLIARELAREGLPLTTFGLLGRQELIVARTADRSVLGCINDMAVLCEHAIATSGGLRQADLADLNGALRRNIDSTRGLAEPQPLNHGPVRSLGVMRTACVLPFAMR